MSLKYPRLHRLIRKQDFQFVFDKPTKRKRQYLIALYRLNDLDYPRLGVIIAKAHVKRAIDRNRLRRVIRESFRCRQEALKGFDIIVLLRSEWPKADRQLLRENVDELLDSIH